MRRAALLALGAALAGACGASSAEIRRARSSAYNANFAIVWTAVADEVRRRDKNWAVDNAVEGRIETDWKLVETRETDDTAANAETGQPDIIPGGVFMRYKVRVLKGGPPWRVVIDAEAASYRPGLAMLQPFAHGAADEPHYVRPRIDALYVDVYHRLKGYAVEISETEAAKPRTYDVTRWPGLPPAAAQVVAGAHAAASARDAAALAPFLASDFRWSLRGEPSSEQAVRFYSADPEALRVLAKTLAGGCAEDAATHVIVCPAGSLEEGDVPRAGFKEMGGVWRMTYFLGGR